MSNENIKTLVVIDLETNGLPSYQFNKCAITEMSLYAFSANNLKEKDTDSKEIVKNIIEEGAGRFGHQPPQLPRSLHKLTLMINPQRAVDIIAEQVTGLSNEMLEKEKPFDKNTAECLNLFLGRLEEPICMVAHNGMNFDFRIIRYMYDKIGMSFPSSIYCIDSLNAFREIDEKRQQQKQQEEVIKTAEEDINNTVTLDPLEQNSHINWQRNNETTPQRKNKTEKRNYVAFSSNLNSSPESMSPVDKRSNSLKVRRQLYSDDFTPKTKYPKKGVYKLGSIFERCFHQAAINLHRAESDVEILTKLILHYGLDFLAYAEERKQPFASVPKLGAINN